MQPRLAVRAVIVEEGRLLLVNAYADPDSTLWCAPGGGVVAHVSLPGNLMREVHEETGLRIRVGAPCLVNEFHAPEGGFHQVEIFFRCRLAGGALRDDWRDPEGVVTRRRWVREEELGTLRFKPASLGSVAFRRGMGYDPLEPIVAP
jgi:ADP-ribose pyrophosphatase YjhB (NUDIX family)